MHDYTPFAFSKIDDDLQFLITCFSEVLTDLDQSELAQSLPWGIKAPSHPLPPRIGQAYSVAFQLLNLAEENAAQQTRRKREREEGMSAERGLWGDAFADSKKTAFRRNKSSNCCPKCALSRF